MWMQILFKLDCSSELIFQNASSKFPDKILGWAIQQEIWRYELRALIMIA